MADIPGASVYGQAGLLAKTAYQNALTRINSQRSNTMRTFGYKADFDQETGVMKNMGVDPSNQYGGYQKMLRTHALAGDEAEESALGRGLSMSGGLGAQYERQLKYNFGQDSANLGQGFTDLLSQLQDQQSGAKWDYDRALYEAQLEAARNAVSEGDYSYSGYDDQDYPQYPTSDYTDPYAQPTGPGWTNPPGGGSGPGARKVQPVFTSSSKNKTLAQLVKKFSTPSSKGPTKSGHAAPAPKKKIVLQRRG